MEEISNQIETIQDLDKLKEIIKVLLEKNNELEIKVKKYSNPERHKNYYENNKQKMIEKAIERNSNLPKEKRNEYQRNWYKRKKEQNENDKILLN